MPFQNNLFIKQEQEKTSKQQSSQGNKKELRSTGRGFKRDN